MRRRIISQGNNSYTLTLPIAWIRQNSLTRGGEVEVEEQENRLCISTGKMPAKRSLTLTIKENHPRGIRFLLQQAYRQNYEQIIVQYSTEAIYQTLQEVAEQYFIGLETAEKRRNSCILTVIVETSEEKFQLFLRKIFLLIRESLQELAANNLTNIHYHYLKLYAYQNYGKRYIYSQKAELSSYDYYSLLSYLLNIHADLEKAAQALTQQKMRASGAEGFTRLAAFLAEMEKNFYLKKPEALMEIGEEIQKMIIKKMSSTPPVKGPSRNELVTWHYQLEIARLLYGALSPLLGIVLYETRKSS